MSSASIIYRACVPCLGSSGIDREPVAKLTCARLRWRELSDITPGLNRTRTPPAILSVAPLSSGCGNWIAIVPPLGGVNWRTAIERTQTQISLAVRAFSRGQRLIVNFCRHLAGSSFRPRVKFCQEPARSVFHRLFVAPIRLPSLLSAHESNVAKGSCHGRQVTCKG